MGRFHNISPEITLFFQEDVQKADEEIRVTAAGSVSVRLPRVNVSQKHPTMDRVINMNQRTLTKQGDF